MSKSSIGRKVLMALSGFFLLFFLLQHMSINLISVFSEEGFNAASHFMGYNPVVQFVLQPILAFGVIFHLAMGIYLEIQNSKARTTKYKDYRGAENATWMSRNMIITGLTILAFLLLHFFDFWFHELAEKYVHFAPEDPTRYYGELQAKFTELWRVIAYSVCFVLLALHLLHGFQSAFQSVGFRHNKYTPVIKKLGNIYGIAVPAVYIFIAVYHYVVQL